MAFAPGDTKYVVVSPNGALDPNPNVAVVSSDTAVVAVSPVDGNPFEFRLDFLSPGLASLSATALSANGSTVNGAISVEVTQPAATALTLAIQDNP